MERLETILNNLGLEGARAEVFAFLAGRKRATPEEIYEGTALSRKAISLALDALEAEGAVNREGPAYRMESAREALMALLPARCEELKAEIYSYRPAPIPSSCPIVEADREEAAALPLLAAKNIDAALQEVDIISGELAWLDDGSLNAARAAVQRGVIVRVIAHEHPGLEADARALRDAGVEVKVHAYADGMSLMVVDGEVVAQDIAGPPGITKPAYLRLTIRDRKTCEKVLGQIFEPAWKAAGTVEEYGIKIG